MPEWTTEGGPNAGNDPKGCLKLAGYALLGVVIAIILIKLGVIG